MSKETVKKAGLLYLSFVASDCARVIADKASKDVAKQRIGMRFRFIKWLCYSGYSSSHEGSKNYEIAMFAKSF